MTYKSLKRYEFLKKVCPRNQLAKDDTNLLIWCPFCNNKNRRKLKLSIHLEKCFYHCWVCDKKGSNIAYLVSKIDKRYTEEARLLFEKPNKKEYKFDLFEENHEEVNNIEILLPKNFVFLAQSFNSTDPDVKAVFKYALKQIGRASCRERV